MGLPGDVLLKKPFAAFLIVIICSLLACTKSDQSGQRFLLPWPDELGGTRLQIIEIESLGSPYEVSGPAAKVYLQSGFSNSGFIGEPIQPNLTLADGVFIPKDVNSSMGLVLYAHMERIFKLDQELGIHQTLPWPRSLGFEILLKQPDSAALEFNNARYFLDWDVISFLPTSHGDTPLTINPGVIAHEHFHAHFNFRVLKALPRLIRLSDVQRFNEEIILRGWSEGLSDYYGFVYSNNPEFLRMSLGEDIGVSRDLALETPHVIRSAAYHEDLFDSLMSAGSPAGGLAYPVGTDVARVLYWLVEEADEGALLKTHRDMLAFVTKGMDRIPEFYLTNFNEKKLEPAALLTLFFLSDEPVLSQVQCDVLLDVAPYVYNKDALEGQCL